MICNGTSKSTGSGLTRDLLNEVGGLRHCSQKLVSGSMMQCLGVVKLIESCRSGWGSQRCSFRSASLVICLKYLVYPGNSSTVKEVFWSYAHAILFRLCDAYHKVNFQRTRHL